MAVSAGFREAVADLFGFVPDLRIKPMFGGAGIYSAELMFGVILRDELLLKADDQTRPLFEVEGCAPWIYPGRGGKPVDMSYSRAPDVVWDDPDEARRWAELALGAALRKAGAKRRSPPRKSGRG